MKEVRLLPMPHMVEVGLLQGLHSMAAVVVSITSPSFHQDHLLRLDEPRAELLEASPAWSGW